MSNFTLKNYPNSKKIFVEWFEPLVRDGKIVYADNGKPVKKRRRISCETEAVSIARQRAPQIIASGGNNSEFSETAPKRFGKSEHASGVTIDQLFDRCAVTCWRNHRSIATLKSATKILSDYLVDETGSPELIANITYQRLEKLATAFRDAGYAESTIRRKMEVLSGALAQACREVDSEGKPWLQGRPLFPKITFDNTKDRVIDHKEEVAIFKAIDARIVKEPYRDWYRFKALMIFLRDVGSRKGETLKVRPSRISERDGRYFVTFPKHETKNGKTRIVPLSQDFLKYLPTLITLAGGDDNPLFPFQPGGVNYLWGNIRNDLKATKQFNIDDVDIHCWRHTCATRMVVNGVDLHRVSKWLGHSSINITSQRYAHLVQEDLLDASDVMDRINSRHK